MPGTSCDRWGKWMAVWWKRRLSYAGYDFYNSNSKIVDLAIKYQYGNATSFSRAFENFHDIKPSQVNKLSKLKIFLRIIFEEKFNVTDEMDYEIVEMNDLILYETKIKFCSHIANMQFEEEEYFEIKKAIISWILSA